MSASRSQRCAGFTMLEVMVAAVVLLFGMGGYIMVSYMTARVELDNDPKARGHDAHLEVLKADLLTDVRGSDAVFAFSGLLQLDAAPLRSSTWSTVAGADYPPIAVTAAAAQAALAAAYAAGGHTLTNPAAPAGQSASTVIGLRSDGRITALWEIVNTQTTVNGTAGLSTVITRFTDEGGAALQGSAYYEQFIPGGTLANPGGPGAARALAAATTLASGRVRFAFPSPQGAGEALAMSGGFKPESASADVSNVDVQTSGRPIL